MSATLRGQCCRFRDTLQTQAWRNMVNGPLSRSQRRNEGHGDAAGRDVRDSVLQELFLAPFGNAS